MPFDAAKFREAFPEFKDDKKYPDSMLEFYYGLASEFIATASCPCSILSGTKRDYALLLLTAHLLSLSLQNQASAASGKVPGAGGPGIETSASIGDISVSRMAPPADDGWKFWLAQTPYGQQLWALLSMLAVGGFAVGGLPERRGFRKINGTFL